MSKLGKLQKLILIYVAMGTSEQTYMKRSILTNGICELLKYDERRKISKSISQSLGLLRRARLIARKSSYIGLTNNGKEATRNLINHIKLEYDGEINWDIILKYYYRKGRDFHRYAKGFVKLIDMQWKNHELFCNILKNFDIRKGDNVSLGIKTVDGREIKLKIGNEKVVTKKKIKPEKKVKPEKKIRVERAIHSVFSDKPRLATEGNFKVYSTLLKMFPKVRHMIDERVSELFKHYEEVRKIYPNYPPLFEEEWNEHPEYLSEWREKDRECTRLIRAQKSDEVFSDYLFEISHSKYPNVDKEVIRLAINKYQKRKLMHGRV